MFKLALAQTTHPVDGDVISLVERAAERAAADNASLLVFPECLMTPYEKTPADFAASAQPLDGAFASAVNQIAARCGLWMVYTINECGPTPDAQPYNTAVVVDDQGQVAGAYRKTHLFRAGDVDEAQKMSAGDALFAPVQTPFCTLGLGICYDLRFPEVARSAAVAGCDLMLFPAAWVAGPNKISHWETLLRARAIENELFVAGVCRVDAGYVGHSMVIDPLGNVLASAADGEALLYADIDLEAVAATRANMPVLEHRRSELYA